MIQTIEITHVQGPKDSPGGWKANAIIKGIMGFIEIESEELAQSRFDAWQELNGMIDKAIQADANNARQATIELVNKLDEYKEDVDKEEIQEQIMQRGQT